MSNPRKKRKARRNSSRGRRSRRNPFLMSKGASSRSSRRSRRSRRNPMSVGGASLNELLKLGVGAAAGAVGTRGLTQAILQDKNQGVMGYGANLVAALGLGWAAGKFIGRDYAAGVAAGGIAATVLRIWSEKVSMSSPAALSGLGDYDFSSDGLGAYVDSYFPTPTISARAPSGYLQTSVPAVPVAAAPAGASTVAAARASQGGDQKVQRFGSRW